MTEKQERSYAKESTKSKPSGIRFDIEKSDFVKQREKLNTFQKVVDFLLNKYWWEHKVAVPTHKGIPPNGIDMGNLNNAIEPTQKMYEEAKSPITGLPPKLSDFDGFMVELKDARTIPQVEDIMKRAKAGIMFPRQFQELDAKAKELSKDMFND